MTELERWALACLQNLRDRDLIKEWDDETVSSDHCLEVEELIAKLLQSQADYINGKENENEKEKFTRKSV
jgi:hypothetical protein